MARFDVHARAGRAPFIMPYLVVVQSNQFDSIPTRVVIPFVPADGSLRRANRVMPIFSIDGHDMVLDALQILTAPRSWLGQVVASLAGDSHATQIIGAIDEAISRGYR